MDDRWAVVLGGGGANGAYEIGVWTALRELNIKYTVVTGTSVGALNGVLMVLGDYDLAIKTWQNMSTARVMADMPELSAGASTIDVVGTFAKHMIRHGTVDTSPLQSLIQHTTDEDIIRNSDIDFGLVTVMLPTMEEKAVFVKDLPYGTIHDYLMASASFFPAFPPHKIGFNYYVDGGYANNVPVDLAMKLRDRFDKMLIVQLDVVGMVKDVEPDCPYYCIRNSVDLGNMMVFDGKRARRNIKIGYFDTMKSFNRLSGGIYAFTAEEYDKFTSYIETSINHLPHTLQIVLQNLFAGKLSGIVGTRLKNKYDNMPTVSQFTVELIAEIFKLPYDELYTSKQFIISLETAVANSVGKYMAAKENISISAIIDAIKNGGINRRLAIVSIANLILNNSADNIAEKISALMPMELASAILIIAFNMVGGRLL